jgi:hypothetical protein
MCRHIAVRSVGFQKPVEAGLMQCPLECAALRGTLHALSVAVTENRVRRFRCETTQEERPCFTRMCPCRAVKASLSRALSMLRSPDLLLA